MELEPKANKIIQIYYNFIPKLTFFKNIYYSYQLFVPTMILSKFFTVPNDCIVCSKHLNSWVLNLLMVFNSIDGFPLDNIKDILKYLVFGDTLKGAFLVKANLWGAKLIDTDLTGADLKRTNLERAKLQGADLKRTNLERARLKGADLRGADLQGANLERANLYGANLERAKLQGG